MLTVWDNFHLFWDDVTSFLGLWGPSFCKHLVLLNVGYHLILPSIVFLYIPSIVDTLELLESIHSFDSLILTLLECSLHLVPHFQFLLHFSSHLLESLLFLEFLSLISKYLSFCSTSLSCIFKQVAADTIRCWNVLACLECIINIPIHCNFHVLFKCADINPNRVPMGKSHFDNVV